MNVYILNQQHSDICLKKTLVYKLCTYTCIIKYIFYSIAQFLAKGIYHRLCARVCDFVYGCNRPLQRMGKIKKINIASCQNQVHF